jgi:hypothetical protein
MPFEPHLIAVPAWFLYDLGGTNKQLKSSLMKLTVLRVLPLLLALQLTANAQQRSKQRTDARAAVSAEINDHPAEAVQCVYLENQLVVSKLKPDEFDKVAVYNMQGSVLLRQKITASTIRMDATALNEGVYLLILQSSMSLKEKSMKFVVRRY